MTTFSSPNAPATAQPPARLGPGVRDLAAPGSPASDNRRLRQGDAVLLVGHGSRSDAGREELLRLSEMTAHAMPGAPVGAGFLELSDPPAGKALDELVEGGARRIAVVPLMLNPAGHAKSDVPAVVLEGRQRHPSVTMTYGRPLGLDHSTVELGLGRIRAAGGTGLPLLVVARGTTEPEANADGAKVTRLLAESCDAPFAVTAYSGLTRPTVPEGLEQCRLLGATSIVQFAWYLCTGVLVDRMRAEGEAFARDTGVPVLWAGHLGADPALVPVIHARALEALEGAVAMSCDLCSYRAPFPGIEDRVGQPIGVGHSHLAVEHRNHGAGHGHGGGDHGHDHPDAGGARRVTFLGGTSEGGAGGS